MAVSQSPTTEKSLIKKLLHENRLNIDNQIKIINLSDENKFKLVIHTTLFDPDNYLVQTRKNILIVEAHYEEKQLDNETFVKQNFAYEHELPADIDPKTIKAYFPVFGYLEIEAPRKV